MFNTIITTGSRSLFSESHPKVWWTTSRKSFSSLRVSTPIEAIKLLFVVLGLYPAKRKYFRSGPLHLMLPDMAMKINNLNDINLSLEGSHESLTPRNIRFSQPAQSYPRSRSAWSSLGSVRSTLSILVISALYSLPYYGPIWYVRRLSIPGRLQLSPMFLMDF